MKDAPIVGPETVRNLAADMRKRTFRDELAVSASADKSVIYCQCLSIWKPPSVHLQITP
jgi:hypothetical protein